DGRIAATQALRDGHQIGHDGFLLAGVQPSRAAHAAHHFVEYEQHAVAIADFAYAPKVAGRRGHRAGGGAHDCLRDERDYALRTQLQQFRLELIGGAAPVFFGAFLRIAVAIFVARIDVVTLDQDRRELLAPPCIAADRQRTQGVAVIALAPGDKVAALAFATLHEILPRHFERRLDRLRPAG